MSKIDQCGESEETIFFENWMVENQHEYHDIPIEDLLEAYLKFKVEAITDVEIYSEGCKYVRKIEQPNRQPLITLRQTFKAGAEFVKKQLLKQ